MTSVEPNSNEVYETDGRLRLRLDLSIVAVDRAACDLPANRIHNFQEPVVVGGGTGA